MFRRIVIVIFVLCSALCSAAQTPPVCQWDEALDRYEGITVQCIQLRNSLKNGQRVSRSELSALLAELSSLRVYLQDASGKMTVAQRRRLEAIRQMYADGKVVNTKTDAPLKHLAQAPEPLPLSFLLPSHLHYLPSQGMTVPSVAMRPDFVVLAELAVIPDIAYGMRVGMFPFKGHHGIEGLGFHVSARSSFRPGDYSYECDSNGNIPGGGKIWSNGVDRVSKTIVTAGAMYRILPWASVYVGAGYGGRALLWQDSDGSWVRVTDRSCNGAAFDAGLLFPVFAPSALSAARITAGIGLTVLPGNSSTPALADLILSVGIAF